MTEQRPDFLVATVDGILALGRDDVARRLDPDEAAALACERSADRASIEQARRSAGERLAPLSGGERLAPPHPLAMAIGSAGVRCWSPALGALVELEQEHLRLLATAADGVVVDDPLDERLQDLVALGLLAVRRDEPHGRAGYLRPSAERDDDEIGEPGAPGTIPVYSVCASHIAGVPLALGMLGASLRAHDDGRLTSTFDLRPLRRETSTTLREVEQRPVPSVFLFSNYTWSVADNLELSATVAARCPGSVVIHGGPSTPRYQGDALGYLDEHPEVDVMVFGEGEVTVVEVLDRLGSDLDVDRVIGVPGTIVRGSDGTVHRGPDRERVADLSTLPSAYLTGLFDHLDGGLLDLMPVETNRGCPFGCTFCDWGSATMSRIRTFPLERVKAELEWIAERDVGTVFITDANFGVLPRDLEIAEHIADLKHRHGAPRAVLVSFAKNQTLRAAQIVKAWIDAGIATEGSVALQTTHEPTLQIINRKNIRVERYDELTEEFRALDLPLAVDLMLGLPGSTVDGFAADLQRCIDRELTARIYPTVVLPNSPMNDPAYRDEHAIVIDANGVVVGSSSYDDEDYAEMLRLRRIYRAGDHFGVLRHVARWAQLDTGVPAVELYRGVDRVVQRDPGAWPSLHWVARHFARFTVPPPSWPELLVEVRRLLTGPLGVPAGPGLDTALAVQAAHLPAYGETWPRRVELDHDYVAWSMQEEPRQPAESSPSGEPTWRPLHDFGPATLVVDDPRGVSGAAVEAHMRFHPHPDVDSVMLNEFWIADDWELRSPLMRRLPQVIAEEPAG